MAWTTISNALVAVGALPFATTIQALRDNPIAIANGDSGAPRVQSIALNTDAAMVSWVGARIAANGAGTIGSMCFARGGGSDIGFGGFIAGSSLAPTSASQGVSVSSTPGSATLAASSTLSGTWQCLGFYDASASDGIVALLGATLWMRVS